MKRYIVTRDEDDVSATVVDGDRTYELGLRLDLFRHSPTGFEYGYSGSGPAQLALALAADALSPGGAELAVRAHQEVKRKIVARWDRDVAKHEVTEDEILAVVYDRTGAT